MNLLRACLLSLAATSLSAPTIAAPAEVPTPAPTAPTAPAVAEPHRAPPGYELVFADEFDVPGLPDPARWAYDTHRNAAGWYNQERQYYSAARMENARVEAGRLVIEARAESLQGLGLADWGGQRYSSARLFTQGRASWTYGFFEIRAKLPCGVGTWPAIWMLPEDPAVKWPEGGEIDIMEHVGFAPGEINQTVHTKAFNFARGSQKTMKFPVADACAAMHRYQLLWTPDFLLMGVDDQPKFMFRKVRGDKARWPFDQPMHLLLNIAVGGTWGGQKGVRDDAFPARMEIDHVRVYQLPAAGAAK